MLSPASATSSPSPRTSSAPPDPPSTSPRPVPLLPPDTSYQQFRTAHLLPNTPCLFPASYTRHWGVFRWLHGKEKDGKVDWKALERRFGVERVEVVDCPAEGEEDEDEEEEVVERFADLLELWKDGRGRKKYLKDWHLPLLLHRRGGGGAREGREKVKEELYEVEECWGDDWMNEWEGRGRARGTSGEGGERGEGEEGESGEREDDFRFVYAGGGKTWTGLHRDVYSSYSITTNLHGRKRWCLFPPSLTPSLRPLLTAASHSGHSINPYTWPSSTLSSWVSRGLLIFTQEQGETLFVPSGWFHSVVNISHPTFSLNHNWANAHCLPAMYEGLKEEVGRAREAIADVRELLEKRRGDEGEGWRREWEGEVDRLVERSEGWSFPSFFSMIHHVLQNLCVPAEMVKQRAELGRWPAVKEENRPELGFVVEQLRPILHDFRHLRPEQEWGWLPGLEETVEGCEREVRRIEEWVEGRRRKEGKEEEKVETEKQ
ncbi:hypothetical protein JCM8547_005745 [Rhodosporidiobolus lusitaniae]